MDTLSERGERPAGDLTPVSELAGEHRIAAVDPGVAAFVGLAPAGPLDSAVRVTSFAQFVRAFSDPRATAAGPALAGGALAHAVRGFFVNGGRACWVVRVPGVPGGAELDDHLGGDGRRGVALAASIEEVSLLAVPDAHVLRGGTDDALRLHAAVVAACERATDVLAVLEPPPDASCSDAAGWPERLGCASPSAALYHPWLQVVSETSGSIDVLPPCGHVAGVLARVALGEGVEVAPTNRALMGVEALAADLDADDQRRLNRAGVNGLRRWPGSEARLWGASTLSDDPDWRSIGRRRLATSLAASLHQGTAWAAQAPKDDALFAAVHRCAHGFLSELWYDGSLAGATVGEAFWIRCGGDARGDGRQDPEVLLLEAGVAVRRGRDFKLVRVVHRTPGALAAS